MSEQFSRCHGEVVSVNALVQQMQLFAGLETDGFAGGDGDLGSCPWVAANAGFSRLDGKDAEAAKFNAVTSDECLFHALEDSVHRSLCFCTWQAGALNNPLY